MMNLERKIKNEEKKQFYRLLTVGLFAVFMILGTVLGLLLPFRPKVSEEEKRELTKFPTANAADFADGDFTSGVGTWYADTFPLRDLFVSAEFNIKRLYGIQKDAVQHIGTGDDIPDIPDYPVDDPSGPDETIPDGSTVPDESETGNDPTEAPSTEPVTEEPTKPTETSEPRTEAPTETDEEPNGQDLARMNPQDAGAVNVKDLVGYCVYGFNLNAANRYAESVAAISNGLAANGVTVYEILVPNNSAVLLDEETKAAWKLSDEQKVLRYYYGKTKELSSSVKTVNIYDALYAHRSEYIYFKTDHHWTQLGAYYAYTEFCKAAGFTANPLSGYASDYSPVFTGSYVHTNGYKQLEDNADSITLYFPLSTNSLRFYDEEQNGFRTGNAIRNLKDFHPRYGYMGYIYGDHAVSYMENPSLKNGRVCLVIKDSFGNCFSPFLIDHYEKLVIVDYRYYKDSIQQLARDEGVTDVVFLNNLEAISDVGDMNVLYDRCK